MKQFIKDIYGVTPRERPMYYVVVTLALPLAALLYALRCYEAWKSPTDVDGNPK